LTGLRARARNSTLGFDRRGLHHDVLAAHRAGQLDVDDANAHEGADYVLSVVARPAYALEQGNDPGLALDGGQLIFYARTDAGIAVEVQQAIGIQSQLAVRQVGQIRRADPRDDLPGDIGGAVIRTADVDRATIARRSGALRVEVHFADAVR